VTLRAFKKPLPSWLENFFPTCRPQRVKGNYCFLVLAELTQKVNDVCLLKYFAYLLFYFNVVYFSYMRVAFVAFNATHSSAVFVCY
jgi:hypothetical protein